MSGSIPIFLREHQELLHSLELPVLRIEATPIMDGLTGDSLPLMESKFGGLPYFPDHVAWPTDIQGDFMLPVAQINFSQAPALPGFPTSGLLQLFLSPTSWYDNVAKVIYHPADDLNYLPRTDFSFLEASVFAESPIQAVHRLSFRQDVDPGSSSDFRFGQQFGPLADLEFPDQLSDEEAEEFDEYFDGSGHKIGGYGAFTQDDPRDYGEASGKSVQLLQIDTDEFITWGDMGIGHLLIDPEDLRTGHLERAVFYWDCH
ncbi:YwqG family protein [Lewinella sp. W8]|uniref:YwqG family protein n=1 Tax=Lewinella sp. W8 TaxID=2528208 RepID=UPI0010687FEE|nr:DUF1963 domain-containing protein [Lewinella sp. W8]MTB50072.1 DUF1963 domain-containing protein [Lewinella sp. W8]